MAMVSKTKTLPQEEVYYPESDGKPMAETDVHRDLMIGLIESLKDFFRDQPEIYVSGNLLVYFRPGDPRACVAPDVFAVKGVKKGERRVYKVWEEKKGPEVVIELTSKGTAVEDLKDKRQIYEEELGVKEYFLYDPLGEYLEPPLQGYRLIGRHYQPIPEEGGRLKSEVLGLELGVEEGGLRLYDPMTGEKLLIPMEQAEARRREAEARRKAEEIAQREAEARRKAEEIAQREAKARQRAEAELARLRAELDALKRQGSGP